MSKISKLDHLAANGTWKNGDEKLPQYEVGFENGDAGFINATKAIPEEFKKGVYVKYDITTYPKWTKIQVLEFSATPIEPEVKSKTYTRDEKIQLAIIAQSTLKAASDYCAAKGLTSSDGEVFSLAEEMFDWVLTKAHIDA